MRRSDQRSGLLWPLMFDEPGLIEMHKRWRRTPGGRCVPDYPSYCLVITDQPRVTTDARTGPMMEPDSDYKGLRVQETLELKCHVSYYGDIYSSLWPFKSITIPSKHVLRAIIGDDISV